MARQYKSRHAGSSRHTSGSRIHERLAKKQGKLDELEPADGALERRILKGDQFSARKRVDFRKSLWNGLLIGGGVVAVVLLLDYLLRG